MWLAVRLYCPITLLFQSGMTVQLYLCRTYHRTGTVVKSAAGINARWVLGVWEVPCCRKIDIQPEESTQVVGLTPCCTQGRCITQCLWDADQDPRRVWPGSSPPLLLAGDCCISFFITYVLAD